MEDSSRLLLHPSAELYLSSLKAGTASISLLPVLDQEHSSNAADSQHVHFNSLPLGVHLHICSYLDARSLCSLAGTCSYLSEVTSDPLLWRRLLLRDVRRWPSIGHLSHPRIYQEACSDLSPKQIYGRCFKCRNGPPHPSLISPLTSRIRSFIRRLQGQIPKVVVFGSGLESLPFVRNLFFEKSSPYTPVGLYPGRDGVGSGVCVQHGNAPVNIITLYTATKAERVKTSEEGSPRVNKLVSTTDGAELTHAVHELCRQANGFILVVNSAAVTEGHDLDVCMVNAMLHSSSDECPLLVVAAHTQESVTLAQSPVEVAETLNLCSIPHHPWQVRSLQMESYDGICEGMDWLLRTADS